MKRAIVAVLLAVVLFVPAVAQAVPDADVQNYVRSVTVQVLVYFNRYTRSLTWYQEVTASGEKGDWKVRKGNWEKDPELSVIAGSGVILYSDILPLDVDGVIGATYILTNAHVVEFLVKEEALGSRYNPLPVYDKKDLIINDFPPSVEVKEGARPVAEQYFKLAKEYVTIKHREDQFYEVRGKVVAYDRALDVALIRLDNVWGLPYATFRGTDCQVGEEIWICGAPLGLPFSIDRGRINQVNLDLGEGLGVIWDNQIKLDIPAAPGSSGSGIFDKDGWLIAELHGMLVYNGNYIEGGQLAIDGQSIREWLIWNGWAFIALNKPYAHAPHQRVETHDAG